MNNNAALLRLCLIGTLLVLTVWGETCLVLLTYQCHYLCLDKDEIPQLVIDDYLPTACHCEPY